MASWAFPILALSRLTHKFGDAARSRLFSSAALSTALVAPTTSTLAKCSNFFAKSVFDTRRLYVTSTVNENVEPSHERDRSIVKNEKSRVAITEEMDGDSGADGDGTFYTVNTMRRRLAMGQPPDLVMSVKSTKNNTHIHLMDAKTHLPIVHISCGMVGYSKSKRRGFEPAFQATVVALQKTIEMLSLPPSPNPYVYDAKNVIWFRFKGYYVGREAAFRAVTSLGWPIAGVEDATPIPYGGPRPKKQRRL